MINVVSNDEPLVVSETEQERLGREACNIDRFNRRQAEAEAEEEARRIRFQPRDLNNAFDRVGEKQVFRTPSANVALLWQRCNDYPIPRKPRQFMMIYKLT